MQQTTALAIREQLNFDFLAVKVVELSTVPIDDSKLVSVEAAGATPKKYTGDLAQTSVGATGSEAQVLGLMNWSIDWKMKTVESTTTDSAGHEESLDSTDSWTAKAQFAFIDADPSQQSQVLAAITSRIGARQWNFFNTVEAGRAAYSGKAYIDGITLATGTGKLCGLDVSLKGTGPLTVGVQAAAQSGQAEV